MGRIFSFKWGLCKGTKSRQSVVSQYNICTGCCEAIAILSSTRVQRRILVAIPKKIGQAPTAPVHLPCMLEAEVSSNGDLHYEKFPTLCSTSQLTFHGWLADALAEVEASPAMASRRGASAS